MPSCAIRTDVGSSVSSSERDKDKEEALDVRPAVELCSERRVLIDSGVRGSDCEGTVSSMSWALGGLGELADGASGLSSSSVSIVVSCSVFQRWFADWGCNLVKELYGYQNLGLTHRSLLYSVPRAGMLLDDGRSQGRNASHQGNAWRWRWSRKWVQGEERTLRSLIVGSAYPQLLCSHPPCVCSAEQQSETSTGQAQCLVTTTTRRHRCAHCWFKSPITVVNGRSRPRSAVRWGQEEGGLGGPSLCRARLSSRGGALSERKHVASRPRDVSTCRTLNVKDLKGGESCQLSRPLATSDSHVYSARAI